MTTGVVERERTLGRESGEMRKKKERGQKKMRHDEPSRTRRPTVTKFATSCRERDGHPSPPAGNLPNFLHQADDLLSCRRQPAVVAAHKSHFKFFVFFC